MTTLTAAERDRAVRRAQARYDAAAERWDLAAAVAGDRMTFHPLTAAELEAERDRVRLARAVAFEARADLRDLREVAA